MKPLNGISAIVATVLCLTTISPAFAETKRSALLMKLEKEEVIRVIEDDALGEIYGGDIDTAALRHAALNTYLVLHRRPLPVIAHGPMLYEPVSNNGTLLCGLTFIGTGVIMMCGTIVAIVAVGNQRNNEAKPIEDINLSMYVMEGGI